MDIITIMNFRTTIVILISDLGIVGKKIELGEKTGSFLNSAGILGKLQSNSYK